MQVCRESSPEMQLTPIPYRTIPYHRGQGVREYYPQETHLTTTPQGGAGGDPVGGEARRALTGTICMDITNARANACDRLGTPRQRTRVELPHLQTRTLPLCMRVQQHFASGFRCRIFSRWTPHFIFPVLTNKTLQDQLRSTVTPCMVGSCGTYQEVICSREPN